METVTFFPRSSSCQNLQLFTKGVDFKKVLHTNRVSRKLTTIYSHRNGGFFDEEAIGAEHGEGFSTFRSRGPLHVDVDFLNDRMRETGLQRIRFAMKPDEAFGLIFSFDNVLADTQELRWEAWRKLALELGKEHDISESRKTKILGTRPEEALKNVLGWSTDPLEIKEMKLNLSRMFLSSFTRVSKTSQGVYRWLSALKSSKIPCALCSSLDRVTLLALLDRLKLTTYFRAFVTQEDGMESMAHKFLSAAVKLDRPPSKCIVFEDDPRGITAAHNCSMKAIAIIGAHPAYELTQADLAVGSFDELAIINLRRLFSVKGTEFMDLQQQSADKKPRGRRIFTDTHP